MEVFSANNLWILFDGSLYQLGLSEKQYEIMLLSIIVVSIFDYIKYRGVDVFEKIKSQALWFRWGIYFIIIFVILIFGAWGGGFDENTFIYFQF